MHRDELNAKKRLWRAKNKRSQNVVALAYYQNHPELLAKNRAYKKINRPSMTRYQREYRVQERMPGGKIKEFRDWLDSLKSGPCSDCGNAFPACAMDWDHIRGEKRFNIANSRMNGWGSEKNKTVILEEIAKCELVCACCHRIRTQQRKEKTLLFQEVAS